MEDYKNLSGESNIEGFEIDEESITVKFISGTFRHYVYDQLKPGPAIVDKMKKLALSGRGLNSYISTTVKGNYSKKY